MDATRKAADKTRGDSPPICAMCGSEHPIVLDKVPLCEECLGPTPALVIEPRTQPRVRLQA